MENLSRIIFNIYFVRKLENEILFCVSREITSKWCATMAHLAET